MNLINCESLLIPEWPAPLNVLAVSTTRHGGVSMPPYDSFNLAEHVGDDPRSVAENRRCLTALAGLPREPAWLEQVHGIEVVAADLVTQPIAADAAFTRKAAYPCVVMTADCLPVLFCDRAGTVVAVAHAGWRGLAGGVLAATVAKLETMPAQLLAWLGPAIGPQSFVVGPEVRAAFVALRADHAEAFQPTATGRWLADLYHLARQQLHHLGIEAVYGGVHCTMNEPERFFSYRREHCTGRMASLIWLV